MPTRRTPAALLLAGLLAAAAAAQPPAAPAVNPAEEEAKKLFRENKFDDALKKLAEAKAANPKLQMPEVTLAGWFFQAQQGQAARMAIEAAATRDPKNPEVYLLNASFAFGEGRVTDAMLSCGVALDLALANDPRWDTDQRKKFAREARLGLAASQEQRRNWEEAKKALNALLADEPNNAQVLARLGTAEFAMGNPVGAFDYFKKAREKDPQADLPDLRMAALYTGKGKGAEADAEGWLKKAVTAAETDPKPHRAYASWLLDAGNHAQAAVSLATAKKLSKADDRETAALEGLLMRYQRNLPAAEQVFETLVKNFPGDSFAAWNLALTLADSGNDTKKQRAIALAQGEVQKNQKAPEGMAVLGWTLFQAGRVDEAEQALGAAAKAGPLSRDAAFFLAAVLNHKQRYEDAHKVLQQAMDARGGFVYKPQAEALAAEVAKKYTPKKDEPKKP